MLRAIRVSPLFVNRQSTFRRYSVVLDQVPYQHHLNAKTLRTVEKIINEEKETEDNIPITTSLFKHRFKRENVPKYMPLREFSDNPKKSVPQLQHGLKRTLFSPGVHYQCDPRTGYSNFNAHLSKIPHIDELKMDKISSFTPSNRDNRLLDISKSLNSAEKKIHFISSTSSMTGLLMKLHSALSNGRLINTSSFSSAFPPTSKFSFFSTVPTSVVVTPKEKIGVYSVDADRSTDTEITLSILGNALELMLTKSPQEFKQYLKSSEEEPTLDDSAYHYAKIDGFLIRSQLDAYNPQLPGKGTFDIKTRAVCAIRMDIAHTNHYPTDYEIHKTHGLMESFERELFDAARIVMFKYSLQARLGNMDGIFVAFHNMKKLLGYQYLPLPAIDNFFFGELNNQRYSDKLFQKSSTESSDDEIIDEIGNFNQNVLKNITNDIGNQYQSKREVLSSKVADYELRASMAILTRIMKQITIDTKGRPYRMIIKKQRYEPRISTNENSNTDVSDVLDKESTELANGDQSKPNSEIKATKEASKSKERKPYRPVELTIVVNVLEEYQLEKMQMLVNERYADALKDLKDYTTMDKIKFLVKNRPNDKTEFYKLNKSILKSSTKKNGFFAYQVKFNHYFNNQLCEDLNPFPDIDFINPESNYKWDIEVELNKINSPTEKQRLFDTYFREISNSTFRHEDSELNVYDDAENGILLDTNASELQNIMRAHSAKAKKRKEMAEKQKGK